MMKKRFTTNSGLTLMEVLATVVILGIVAALVIPRVYGTADESQRQACYALKGLIEVQVQRWWRQQGSPPQSNLSDIYANPDYFPQGGHTCPVDGTTYTIDTTTGEVVGHDH